MSRLYYYFGIGEYHTDDQNNVTDYYDKNLPHFKELADWLPLEWDKSHIEKTFTGVLKDKIQSCTASLFRKKDGCVFLCITVEGVKGFRFSEKRRNEVFEQLDMQVVDGWGESFSHTPLPNLEHYYLEIL